MRSPDVIVVVGGQWGDEGKGKEVDFQAGDSDLVIRSNGGANAGHTVINTLGKFALHLTPAGIFNHKADNLIGNGVALSVDKLLEETDDLNRRRISTDRLFISEKTHLTFAYHRAIDGMQEEERDARKIGTTKTGNGPTYMDKAERLGIRAAVLRDRNRAMDTLNQVLKRKAALYYPHGNAPEVFNPEYYEQLIESACAALGEKVINPTPFLAKHFASGSRILVEAAHGALLDIDSGTFPFVTSSSCTVGGVLNGAEIPPSLLTDAIGVFKAYCTRVGEGPFVTELCDEEGEEIRKKGNEFGTTTGRPRRVGWFDGVASKYSQQINRFNRVVVTRLDVLTGISPKICRGYLLGDKVTDNFPPDCEALAQCQPLYEKKEHFPAWKEDISGSQHFEDLSVEAQNYAKAVVESLGAANLKSITIGTGPRREDRITISSF